VRINAFSVLWDNTTRVIFTLAAAVLGIVAVYLTPGRKQIEERMTAGYSRMGKYAIFVLAFLVMGIAGVLGWEVVRYRNRDLWVGGNMLVLAVLGIGIFGGNIWTMRLVKQAEEHVEVVEAEVVEVSAEDGTQPGQPQVVLAPRPESPPVARVEPPAGPMELPKQ
jgi:hypothetical protein